MNPGENRRRKDLLMWLGISAISSLLFSYIKTEVMEEIKIGEPSCVGFMLAVAL